MWLNFIILNEAYIETCMYVLIKYIWQKHLLWEIWVEIYSQILNAFYVQCDKRVNSRLESSNNKSIEELNTAISGSSILEAVVSSGISCRDRKKERYRGFVKSRDPLRRRYEQIGQCIYHCHVTCRLWVNASANI